MSEQPTVTERQAVERERAAFCRGVSPLTADLYQGEIAEEVAAKLYPLPKVRRLRVYQQRPGFQPPLRYNPERVRWETFGTRSGEWDAIDEPLRWAVALADIEALADLKANPYEEVDA